MKTLYLDCSMGAAGDMLSAALFELLTIEEQKDFINRINHIGLENVHIVNEASVKCGIVGTHMKVLVDGEEESSQDVHNHANDHNHHHDHDHDHNHDYDHDHDNHQNHDHDYDSEHHHTHQHSSMSDITQIVNKLHVSECIQKDILSIYSLIAEAESAAHGVEVHEIHFHEVGTMDAIADITSVCMLMDIIAPDRVICSPVHVGSGHVHCAHGVLPVPAPATAYILKDIPIYGGAIEGELCTPTGAALIKFFVNDFGNMPVTRVSSIGYGMGKKDFEVANCVRTMLGESDDNREFVYELNCNVDDMTAEEIGCAMKRIFEAGAMEVYTVPIGMKKSRPGVMIKVLCKDDKKEDVLTAIFKHTSTIGIRELRCDRHILDREVTTVHTKYGDIRRKMCSGYGVHKCKYEYDDLEKVAHEQGMSMRELLDSLD